MFLIVAVIGNIRQQRQTITNVLDVVKSIAGQANDNRQQHGLYAHYGFAAESHRLWMQEIEAVSATRLRAAGIPTKRRAATKKEAQASNIHLF